MGVAFVGRLGSLPSISVEEIVSDFVGVYVGGEDFDVDLEKGQEIVAFQGGCDGGSWTLEWRQITEGPVQETKGTSIGAPKAAAELLGQLAHFRHGGIYFVDSHETVR